MSYIVTGTVCLLVGFVAGLLVYRKHANKLIALERAAKVGYGGTVKG